jgi:DNA-binding SARP family transcriptional activator
MAALATRSRLTREYLGRHVLADLDERTRRFLVRTSVLGKLTGPLCDRFLDTEGSNALLAMLERRQLFTHALDGRGSYRYHDVLRAHLESVLVEELGEAAVRDERKRAGALLETEEGGFCDALEAYCRAEDWEAAGRLLGLHGERLAGQPGWWSELLPSSLLEQDGWVLLAVARRHRAAGSWHAALAAYQKAERIFGDAAGGDVCRREAAAVAAWSDGVACPAASGWPRVLREATFRQPVDATRAAMQLSKADGRIAYAWASILAGQVAVLERAHDQSPDSSEGSAVALLAERMAHCVAAMLRGEPAAEAIVAVAEDAERAGLLWLSYMATQTRALCGGDDGLADDGWRSSSEHRADPWGPPLAWLARGWWRVLRGIGTPAQLTDAAAAFAQLRAPVLECWADALRAVAEVQDNITTAAATARHADASARALGVPGARAYALAALGQATGDRNTVSAAREMAARLGLRMPPLVDDVPLNARGAAQEAQRRHASSTPTSAVAEVGVATSASPTPRLAITCLGQFVMAFDGRPLDLTRVKPKVRSLLRLLAMHSGTPVHREVILEALWPDMHPDAGTRSLHVAVSALRHLIEPGLGRADTSMVHRDGDAYALVLCPGTTIDILDFQNQLTTAARSTTDVDACAALGAALALYRDDLLPEEGPAEWVMAERERHRAAAVGAATRLATFLLRRGDTAAAAAACHRGLAIDRYQDALWRLLIEVHGHDGAPAAAERVRRQYAAVLSELNVRMA